MDENTITREVTDTLIDTFEEVKSIVDKQRNQ